MAQPGIDALITQLASCDPLTRRAGRDGLLAFAIEHMRAVAHRMVRGFPGVRRWDETDDVVQGAALRLTRALDGVVPADARHVLGLIALQVRRELIDLSRRYRGAESFARHHETNAARIRGEMLLRSDAAIDDDATEPGCTSEWTRFHEAAGSLDEDERELFNLVWYLGLDQEQTAHTLGCSVRTVARRWDLVKRHLVRRLGGQAPT
jgi:RNA polymerase sigma factor (sigma-70 family)